MRKREEPYITSTLTAMIDVVFQLIIFFVCAVAMQDKALDQSITLALAPNGTAIKGKNPLEITVDVDKRGTMSIARTPMSKALLYSVLKKSASVYGADNIPVIIRGDGKAKHEAIKLAMDACAEAGIYKIKFAALKERGSQPSGG